MRRAFLAALCLSLPFGVVVSAQPQPARAEVIEVDKERLYGLPSTEEDVALSFLKMAKVAKPEFDQLILKTDKYKMLDEKDKSTFLETEVLRLKARYLAINPETSNLLLRVAVKAYFIDSPEGQQGLLQIKFPSEGMAYFPFYYGGLPVALIPDGIENFQSVLLSETEKDIVASTLDPVPEATLILDLQPVSADIRHPMMLDGAKQFPLLCKITYIGLHNRDTNQVWAWSPTGKGKAKSDSILKYKQ